MQTLPMLEELMESRGAQGSDATNFIKHSRVIYRIRPSKLKGRRHDMTIGYGNMKLKYARVNLGVMLNGFNIVVYDPTDPIGIIQRTLHLDTRDLNVSDVRYDKKRRRYFISVTAKRDSNVFAGGGRVYLSLNDKLNMKNEFELKRK